jgi:D-glycero-D-manno-heptose 1,7-bisphosphate phosphatase
LPVRLVILDRDGVINHDSDDFIKSAAEWRPITGSIDAIARLSQAGFTVTVASNQSGIGRGLFSLQTLAEINDAMRQQVTDGGGNIDRVIFCPHLPDEGCRCRKPQPGMLLDLADHYGVELSGVPFVGDSLRDLQAAIAAGARPVLVRTGNGQKAREQLQREQLSVEVFADLAAVADALIAEPNATC